MQGQGRRIPDPGFAGDEGDADPVLRAALGAHGADPGRLPEVLAALHRARVLVPVVAVLGEQGVSESGLTVDKSADIALPLLTAADGARAVPAFSGLDSLARWDPSARPVPVMAAHAAAVAAGEGAVALVVDLAGPYPASLGEPELHALREGRGGLPAYLDETLRVALHQALAEVGAVDAAWLGPWPGADARLTVAVAAGADVEEAGARVLDRVHGLLATAGGGVRGVDLALQRAGAGDAPPGARPVLRR